MVGLVIAFSIVWVATALYVGWIGAEQRRLSTRLHRCHERMTDASSAGEMRGKAA